MIICFTINIALITKNPGDSLAGIIGARNRPAASARMLRGKNILARETAPATGRLGGDTDSVRAQ